MNELQKANIESKLSVLENIPRQTTLARVQNSREVSSLGSRDDGSLSDNQKHLITTVVTFMQDEIAQELRTQRQILLNELEAQRSAFIEWSRSVALGIFSFAKTGMFTSPKADEDDARPFLLRVFTWGNFLSGSAIVLVAIAGFTTHTYLAYKELAEVKDKELSSLKLSFEKQGAALTAAQATGERESDKAAEKDKMLIEKQAEITVLKSQLELKEVKEESELQKQLSDALLKASQAQAAADKGKPEMQRLRDRIATLTQLKKDLEEEGENLRAENRQKAEAIESLTRKLAKAGS